MVSETRNNIKKRTTKRIVIQATVKGQVVSKVTKRQKQKITKSTLFEIIEMPND